MDKVEFKVKCINPPFANWSVGDTCNYYVDEEGWYHVSHVDGTPGIKYSNSDDFFKDFELIE